MGSASTADFASFSCAQMRELYERDPALFEELAADAISRACIGKSAAQTLKLRQMQWVIDAQLRKGKTPLEKLRIMESIFYDQVYSRDGLLDQLIAGWARLSAAVNGSKPAGDRKPKLRLLKN